MPRTRRIHRDRRQTEGGSWSLLDRMMLNAFMTGNQFGRMFNTGTSRSSRSSSPSIASIRSPSNDGSEEQSNLSIRFRRINDRINVVVIMQVDQYIADKVEITSDGKELIVTGNASVVNSTENSCFQMKRVIQLPCPILSNWIDHDFYPPRTLIVSARVARNDLAISPDNYLAIHPKMTGQLKVTGCSGWKVTSQGSNKPGLLHFEAKIDSKWKANEIFISVLGKKLLIVGRKSETSVSFAFHDTIPEIDLMQLTGQLIEHTLVFEAPLKR